MTRKNLLQVVVRHAHANGFDFRRWFVSRIQHSWKGMDAAIETIATEHRYYALLFSHDFARCFWKDGSQISFLVPAAQYVRRDKNGTLITVHRKQFTRRTLKPDVWKYHLREMAASDDPAKYIRRFIVTREDLAEK